VTSRVSFSLFHGRPNSFVSPGLTPSCSLAKVCFSSAWLLLASSSALFECHLWNSNLASPKIVTAASFSS
jgi:hypothetical protein